MGFFHLLLRYFFFSFQFPKGSGSFEKVVIELSGGKGIRKREDIKRCTYQGNPPIQPSRNL